MLIYARARRASNLVAGFLARDLKKSSSNNSCAKALALTSWVADGTSKAAMSLEALLPYGEWRRGLIRSFGAPCYWRINAGLGNKIHGSFLSQSGVTGRTIAAKPGQK
ncbi:UNVERIFIED_CONTAM: hypothetical protein Sradi_6455300 [Sesamum radiatum]|uniref:Uncharacterized protein n=1 Tax=Sesamum radiatum TaxID=300843 RepID=A0AAW2K556_SESRA